MNLSRRNLSWAVVVPSIIIVWISIILTMTHRVHHLPERDGSYDRRRDLTPFFYTPTNNIPFLYYNGIEPVPYQWRQKYWRGGPNSCVEFEFRKDMTMSTRWEHTPFCSDALEILSVDETNMTHSSHTMSKVLWGKGPPDD